MHFDVPILCLVRRDGPWTIRIDGPHLSPPLGQKHIHITRREINGEYSWNMDGTRHDEHRFPSSGQMMKAAKRIAAKHLGVRQADLQFLSINKLQEGVVRILVEDSDSTLSSLEHVAVSSETFVLIGNTKTDRVFLMLVDRAQSA